MPRNPISWKKVGMQDKPGGDPTKPREIKWILTPKTISPNQSKLVIIL